MPHPAALEATVTSKGQITLPKMLRERLGLKRGSRIRFRVDAHGRLQGEPILYDLEDLWAMADQARRPKRAMTSDEMDAAKARRRW
ncbi:MAG: AbrB/MazE/SpoVT family DNA-binding domain-containing protein [Armatimonadetes bacterium]|nr:AbrB/MazE/SpoVT family DNA-binding domain-containing protein [Armatimonadota bacterium]